MANDNACRPGNSSRNEILRAVATGACAVSLLDALVLAGAVEEVDDTSASPTCIDAESLISL